MRKTVKGLGTFGLIMLLAAALLPAQAASQPLPVGGEIRVNTTTAESQFSPDVAMDDAGNFVIVWEGGSYFGSRRIFAQRFAASGTPLGGEFQVNTYTGGYQTAPRVGMDSAGDFVVTWSSFRQNPPAIFSVIGRRYDRAGNSLGGEFSISESDQSALFQDVAMDADGNFLVAWEGRSPVTFESVPIQARLYGSDGTPRSTPFAVTPTPDTAGASVTAAPGGSWVVSWTGPYSNTGSDILARRLDANGDPVGSEVVVPVPAEAPRQNASVAAGGDRVVVSWTEYTGNNGSPRTRLFDDGLAPRTGDLGLSTLPAQPTQEMAVAMDGAGRFVVAWVELDLTDNDENVLNPTRDGSAASILARPFDADGNPLGGDFVVNTTTESFQAQPRLAMSPSGRLAATWIGPGADHAEDVFAQVFASNAAPEARCRNLTVPAGPSCTAGASIDNNSFDPDPADTITLAQSPAGPYSLGATGVTLTVTDNHGAASSCLGTVTVADTTPPAIVCPAAITANGSLASGGATVSFAVSATDACDASLNLVTSRASGSLFLFGTTTVSATATDDAGNSASCSFTVTVLTPQSQIAALTAQINALVTGGALAANKANPLITKLDQVVAKLDGGQTTAACGQLGAFLNQVNAYIGNGTLTATQGQALIDATNAIKASIGC